MAGRIFKISYVRPLPDGARVVNKGGRRVAQWTESGRSQSAPVKESPSGPAKIVLETEVWIMRFRDHHGAIREMSTGCRDRDAAQAVLGEALRKVELVKAGIMTSLEGAAAEHAQAAIAEHVAAYVEHLRPRTSRVHPGNIERQLNTLIQACGFRRLADISRGAMEKWMTGKLRSGKSARTANTYRGAQGVLPVGGGNRAHGVQPLGTLAARRRGSVKTAAIPHRG